MLSILKRGLAYKHKELCVAVYIAITFLDLRCGYLYIEWPDMDKDDMLKETGIIVSIKKLSLSNNNYLNCIYPMP